MFGQIWAIAVLNVRNTPSRWGSSAVIVVGTAGVVGVLVLILSMAGGIQAVFDSTIDLNRALVLRDGSTEEMSSQISRAQVDIIRGMPEVAVAAAELYAVADIEKRSSGTPANLIVRGVQPESFLARPNIKITAGRSFSPGRDEIIVGKGAVREFVGLEIGSEIELRDSSWFVVGHFEDEGSAAESEIWVDLPMAQAAFRRSGSATAMRIVLHRGEDLESLNQGMLDDPRLQHEAISEAQFYQDQSKGATLVIRVFGYLVVVVMAIGAIFAALNTMYSAVASRTFEIATLRAIGFRGIPVIVSVMLEAIMLGLAGGMLGALLVYLAFDNFSVSTMNQMSFSQLSFSFKVTLPIMAYGLVWAVSLGFLGGLFPAVRAVRQPITVALRGE